MRSVTPSDQPVKTGSLAPILPEHSSFSDLTAYQFGIGTGLDDALRAQIWSNPDAYVGRIVKYKYFPVSIKEKPRHPVFLRLSGFGGPIMGSR